MFSKIDVNGSNAHPVYQFLRKNSSLWDVKKNQAEVIPWNFAKFMVNEAGEVKSYHPPAVAPTDLIEEIKSMLWIQSDFKWKSWVLQTDPHDMQEIQWSQPLKSSSDK